VGPLVDALGIGRTEVTDAGRPIVSSALRRELEHVHLLVTPEEAESVPRTMQRFKQEIAAALKRRVAPLPPGPPPKAAKDTRQTP